MGAGSFELAPVDARAWPEVGSPARWTSSRRLHQHDERRESLPLWQVRRGLGGAVELNRCAQADFSPSVSHAAPKIHFAEARFRCVTCLTSNRVEIMLRVMCACDLHAWQVIPRLQESILYENLTGEVAAVYRFEEYLPLAS